MKAQLNAAQTGTSRLEDLVTQLRRKTEYYRSEHDAMSDQLAAAENKHKVCGAAALCVWSDPHQRCAAHD